MGARNTSNKPTKTDLAVVILSPIIATVITVAFKTNMFVSTLLYFGLPALYLSYKRPCIVRKSLIFTLATAIPLSLAINYLAYLNQSWYITSTIFSFRLFDLMALEDFMFAFLWIYFAIIFYEYFTDSGSEKDTISHNLIYLSISFFSLLIILLLLVLISPRMLQIDYFYLKGGIITLLLPLVIFLRFFPKFLKKFAVAGLYFFSLSLLFELSALYTNQWTFPGNQFVGFAEIFGLRFPYEDVLFWFILGVYGILAYYEFFADDRK